MNKEQIVQNSLAIKVAELTLQNAQLDAELQLVKQELQNLQSDTEKDSE